MEISAAVNATGTIAIVEDDTSMREALRFQLETAGHRVVSHPSAESFLEHGASKQFDCIVVDVCLPRMNGLQLLAQIKLSLPFFFDRSHHRPWRHAAL